MKLDSVRHEQILSQLTVDSKIAVAELAEKLEVSMETIRRDLRSLETRGLLRRIHGGAVPLMPQQDRPLMERNRIAFAEKAIIAGLATPLLTQGMSIFLDTGTTTVALARMLGTVPSLTVYTNSIDIALVVSRQKRHQVNLTGGSVRINDNALLGYDALDCARRYYYDIAFMGIAAVDLDRGFMDYEDHEAELRRALVQQSSRRVILVDQTKFGRRGRVRTFDFGAVDILISDAPLQPEFNERFVRAGVDVIHG